MRGITKAKVFRHFWDDFKGDSDRWFPWLPVCFGGGIGLYFALPHEPHYLFVLIGCLSSLVALLLTKRTPFLFFAAGILTVIILGMGTAQLKTAAVKAPVLEKRIGPVTLEGKVLAVEKFSDGIRTLIGSSRISGVPVYNTPRKVRIRFRGKTLNSNPGDWIRAKAVLMPPAAPAIPGEFDFQRYAFFKEIGGVGYGLGAFSILKRAAVDDHSFEIWLEKLRYRIGEKIRNHIPGQTGAVAVALITGDRSGIDEQAIEKIRQAGLAHLLAISGLHIGLVAGSIFLAVRGGLSLFPAVVLRFPIKKWAATASIFGAFGYALIAGASIPTQRAFLMVGLALLGMLIDRETISLRSLAWVALLILFFYPEAILGPSFQMSFAAVTALIAFYGYWQNRRDREVTAPPFRGLSGKIARYLLGISTTTLVASAATAPFALYHFGQIATFGIIANLVAVPLAALWIMPAAVVSICMMPFGWELPFLWMMGQGIELLLLVSTSISNLSNATFGIAYFPTTSLVFLVLGGLLICLSGNIGRRLGAITLVVSVVAIPSVTWPTMVIENTGDYAAVVTGNAVELITENGLSKRSGRSWLERTSFNVLDKKPSDSQPNISKCDSQACILEKGGISIAYVYGEGALLEECYRADVVVSKFPIRRDCPFPKVVIDRFDLWRNGSYAIFIKDDVIEVVNDREVRGNRPWVTLPKPKTQ